MIINFLEKPEFVPVNIQPLEPLTIKTFYLFLKLQKMLQIN